MVGRLLTASHRSSQHLFENSTSALDAVVTLLEPHPAVLGGAVMALTKDTFTGNDAAAIARRHAAAHGRAPEVIHLQSADSATVLPQA